MTNTLISHLAIAAIAAMATIAIASSVHAQEAPTAEEKPAPPAMFLTAADMVPSPLCKSGEQTVFQGSVRDDLGLDIAVCIAPETRGTAATINLRSVGEGGEFVVSCQAEDCEGVIGMQHYRRPRFTILTLEWVGPYGSRQKMVETHYAPTDGDKPQHLLTHSWTTAEMIEAKTKPMEHPVAATTDPLSLLTLGQVLDVKNWPDRALPKAANAAPADGNDCKAD